MIADTLRFYFVFRLFNDIHILILFDDKNIYKSSKLSRLINTMAYGGNDFVNGGGQQGPRWKCKMCLPRETRVTEENVRIASRWQAGCSRTTPTHQGWDAWSVKRRGASRQLKKITCLALKAGTSPSWMLEREVAPEQMMMKEKVMVR